VYLPFRVRLQRGAKPIWAGCRPAALDLGSHARGRAADWRRVGQWAGHRSTLVAGRRARPPGRAEVGACLRWSVSSAMAMSLEELRAAIRSTAWGCDASWTHISSLWLLRTRYGSMSSATASAGAVSRRASPGG